MNLLTVILIALGLSMDAFAVSVANGIAVRRLKPGYALRIALYFGGFQALMPLLGWASGLALRGFLGAVDHWIALVLLCFIGGKMIWESSKLEQAEKDCDPLKDYTLLVLAIATSIDALVVGFTFACLKVGIVGPVLIIGATTFVLCLAGVFIGNRFGHLFEKKIEIVGGLILIGIGVKIFVQHMFFK
jgi:putative Mn2+ efflux pump MntP